MQLNRKIHRWMGIIAVIFFLSVSITGVVLQYQAIFGEEESAHEAMAEMRSPITTAQVFAVDVAAFERASLHLEYARSTVHGPAAIVTDARPANEFRIVLRASLQRYVRH